MFEIITFIAKTSLTVASISIAALGVWQKWVFKTDKLFGTYSKLSNFSFELAKKTGDPTLEKISVEYGYAAITRDKKLSHEERLALLKMVNPVNGIEEYHRCSNFIKVNIIDNCFEWRHKRHRNKIYQTFLQIIFTITYFIGCAMFFSPVFYLAFIDTDIAGVIQQLPPGKKLATFAFLILYGAIFLIPSLNTLSKLNRASAMIKKSKLQSRRWNK
ncbi:hypothetical protein RX799_03915 [Klebsiella oxytoca]|uniref:hypothetical protein n=1 Tax=Klebsiella oxytoca TaxID=571 RepID=UPI00384BA88A